MVQIPDLSDELLDCIYFVPGKPILVSLIGTSVVSFV